MLIFGKEIMASKKNSARGRKIFTLNSGMEKLSFKKDEILSRTWLIRGDPHAKGQVSKGRKEVGNRTERMEDRERRGTQILCTYIVTDILLLDAI